MPGPILRLGFARQLSQRPGLYCRLEVKIGENSFNFQTGSPGNFPDKGKSPSDYKRDQRRRKPCEKGMPTPGNHGVGSVALETLQEQRWNNFLGSILSSLQ